MKKLIPTFTLVLLILLGCKKTEQLVIDSITNSIPITEQSQANQVAYANENLMKIGKEIAKLTGDQKFVDFVRNSAKKKFDDEYEVLIEDLKKDVNWSYSLNTLKMNEGLNAFKKIGGANGGNYYPQIYIPTFQYDEDENISNSTNVAAPIDSILYVFYGGDAEVDSATNLSDSYPAYIRLPNSTFAYWGLVNEAYANTHEVWIFSINEVVNGWGQYREIDLPTVTPETPDGPSTGGGAPPTGSNDPDYSPVENFLPIHPAVDDATHAPVNFKIQNMIVKNSKESWLAGASEISIKASLLCHNNRALGAASPAGFERYRSNQYSNHLGKLIRKFKRREVNHQDNILVNFTLQTGWPTSNWQTDPIFFDYLIFEKDNWPAPLKTQHIGGRRDYWNTPFDNTFFGDWDYQYRANNPSGTNWGFPYITSSFTNTNVSSIPFSQPQYYSTGSVGNSEIIFNTVGF